MTSADKWLDFAPEPLPLTGGDKYHVFLSYRSVNRPWVITLYDVLRQHGHEVFLDQVVLKAGDRLIRELERGLESSQNGVLVWSSAAADSDWVRSEYETLTNLAGGKEGFHFVPVRLDDEPLPLFAQNLIFLDFSAYPDGPNGGELLRLLHAVAGQPLSPEAAIFADKQDELARSALKSIAAAIRNGDTSRLTSLFEEGGLPWEVSPALGSKAAEGLLELEAGEQAFSLLNSLREQFPRAIRPIQLHALALARRGQDGDLGEAQSLLGKLYEEGERDPETLGIYARTWMDRFAKSGNQLHLQRSRDLYVEAFEGAGDDYYTGINAAAKSVMLGELETAATLAERVQEIVGTNATAGDYWTTATVGEVFLIRQDYPAAARLYGSAVAGAPDAAGNHSSTWTQACRLMLKLQPSDEERALIRQAFSHLPDCDEQEL